MSYDLSVFEPSIAPRRRQASLDWYDGQVRWTEPHGYGNPEVSSPGLAGWFRKMIEIFPPLNEPFQGEAGDDPDEANTAEYSVGRAMIYVCFRWSQRDMAHAEVRRLAAIHRVGFLDASGEGTEIVFPSD